MRKQLIDRDWIGLKSEAGHVAEGAQNFGYPDLAEEVEKALGVLEKRHLSRTAVDPDAKDALEKLFQKLDHFLVNENEKQ